MKRVLVTGAAGFVGSHCLAPLREAGFEVHALTRDATPDSGDGSVWHRADLYNVPSIEDLLDRVQPTHLLHLAWYVQPGKCLGSPENFRLVPASLALALSFQRRGGQRMVAAGSAYEYDWSYGYCSEDRTPLAPSTVYGACKLALHQMLQSGLTSLPLGAAWARIFFVYGPNEHPDRLVPYVIRSILEGKTASCSHGRQIRDYLHVQDVADALVRVLDSGVTGPVNIASGQPVVLRDIVTSIGRMLDGDSLVALGAIPARANDTPVVLASVDRLHAAIEWQPRFSLETGLAHTIEWWRTRTACLQTLCHGLAAQCWLWSSTVTEVLAA